MYLRIFEKHAQLLKALSHPRRLEIINLLRDQELCVSDIYEMLDLPQANISQHLMILRDSGLLTAKREGKQIIYFISDKRIIYASDLLREVMIDTSKDAELEGLAVVNMKELVPLVHDPVCQMRVSPKTAGSHTKYDGKEYFFCATGCLKKFQEKPEKYVKS